MSVTPRKGGVNCQGSLTAPFGFLSQRAFAYPSQSGFYVPLLPKPLTGNTTHFQRIPQLGYPLTLANWRQ